jgi:hypothetical protein
VGQLRQPTETAKQLSGTVSGSRWNTSGGAELSTSVTTLLAISAGIQQAEIFTRTI